MKKYITQEAVNWIAKLAKERLGSIDLRLEIDDCPYWILSIVGFGDAIRLPFSQIFYSTDNEVPYGTLHIVGRGADVLLPAAGQVGDGMIILNENDYLIQLDFDVFGFAYWMLNRLEEYDADNLDEHSRFPASNSHAQRYGYLNRPVIDEWFKLLLSLLGSLIDGYVLNKTEYQLVLSHDVDMPSRYGFSGIGRAIRTLAGDVYHRRQLSSAWRIPYIWLNTKTELLQSDPANTFDWIMDTSEKYGHCNAFYFMAGKTTPKRDGTYSLDHLAIRHLMKKISDRGHEIGLHPSYGTYLRPDLLQGEVIALKQVCSSLGIKQNEFGARMHYLRWKTPDTLWNIFNAGLNYDTTLGYADAPGFRCGTCHEFSAFNHAQQKMLPLKVRPLIAMDCTVIGPSDIKNVVKVLEELQHFVSQCRSVGGQFTTLWHNTSLMTAKQKHVYQTIFEM